MTPPLLRPGPCCQAAGRGRAVKLQHVEELHIGEAKAGLFRRLSIEEDARGDELADFKHDAVGGSDWRRQLGDVRLAGERGAIWLEWM